MKPCLFQQFIILSTGFLRVDLTLRGYIDTSALKMIKIMTNLQYMAGELSMMSEPKQNMLCHFIRCSGQSLTYKARQRFYLLVTCQKNISLCSFNRFLIFICSAAPMTSSIQLPGKFCILRRCNSNINFEYSCPSSYL